MRGTAAIAVLGQREVRWSASVTVPGNATVTGIVDGLDLSRQPGTLSVTVLGSASVTVTVTERWQQSQTVTVYSIGLNGSLQAYVSGSVTVDVSNGTANAATVKATLNPDQGVARLAPLDSVVALSHGGGGAVPAPGAYADVGTGYPPDGRTTVTVIPRMDYTATNPGVDLQLLDSAGAQVAYWRLTEPRTFTHPPRFRLQARHPGGAGSAAPRAVVGTWTRGS